MKKCILNNYSNLEIRIPVTGDSNVSIDDLVKIVTSRYKRDNSGNFTLSKNLSTNPNEFEKSLDNFINLVINNLEDLGLSFNKDEFISKLRSYYLVSNIDTLEDLPNEAILPEAKTISIEELQSIELNDILNELFNNNYAIKSHFLLEFKHKLKDKTIIHIGDTIKKSSIVYDVNSLNESLTEYMNLLFLLVVGYMKSNNIPLPNTLTNMFVLDSKIGKQYKINPGYIDILNAFYNHCINNSNYLDIMEIDFHNKILGDNKENTLLDAVQAYIGISYFDDLLKETLPKYIYINKNLVGPISYDDKGKPLYKYDINKKNLNIRSGWHSEVSDGISELGDFSVIAMETIPLRNKYGYLTKQDFIISFMKLKNLVQNVTDKNSNLYKAAEMLKDNTVLAWKIILEYIKNADNLALEGNINAKNALINKSIFNHEISDNDWNTYVSVYDYIFNKNNGVYYIERDSTRTNGITDNYRITDSIFGSLNSTSDLNYMVCRYDSQDKTWKIEEKPKFYSNLNRFLIKYSINKNSRNNNNIETSLNFTFGDTSSFLLGKNRISIRFSDSNIEGMFGINDSLKSLTLYLNGKETDFSEYFKQLLNDIMFPSKRDYFINHSLEGKDLEFVTLLKLFDNLFETNYSSNETGLQEFRILLDLNKNALNLLVAESFHSLASSFLNQTFLNERGDEYDSKSIDKWLAKQSYPFVGLKAIERMSIADRRKYIEDTKEGVFLLGFSSNKLLDDMGDARTIILGDNNKSTIKNFNNDSVPNISVAYTDFKDEVRKQELFDFNQRKNNGDIKTPVGHLLFTGNSNAIKTVVIDSEVKMPNGTSKLVSDFTASELLYHSIFNKFLMFNKTGQWLSLPITYSDKTKFLNLLVDIESLLGTKNIFSISNLKFEERILNTIGNYYKSIYTNIANDYRKIFDITGTDLEVIKSVNKLFEEINNSKLNPFEYLMQLADSKNVKLFEDLHYRKGTSNKINSTNELLEFFINNVYKNRNTLNNIMREEKINFLNSLLKEMVIFPVSDLRSTIEQNIKDTGSNDKWITDNGLLILAKISDSNGKVVDLVTGEEIPHNSNVLLNPVLEKYFYMHNLIDNNAKLHFSGNELVHKLKSIGSISNAFISTLTSEEKNIIKISSGKNNITLEDVLNSNNSSIINKVYPYLKQILSGEHNAQFKRTVPIPGTMRLFDLNRIDGITSSYNTAVILDVQAEVNDLSGNYGFSKSKTIDAHDGSAWVNPFTSILENKSLSESESGHVKKPLWDVDEPLYGTRRLIKYASDAITNEIMRNSARGASINMYKLFEKMTNFRWNGNIDLTHWDAFGWNENTFRNNILKGNNLYYKFSNLYFLILDFGISNGSYWTKELEVDLNGIPIANSTTIKYHYFDNITGEHYITNNSTVPENTHTIDSLFELHTIFGGINSISLINKEFSYGEDSNQVVVEFMNGVTYLNDNYRKLLEDIIAGRATKKDLAINQTYYDQPLKKVQIDVIINLSAIKNGASNINGSNVYYDNSKLRYDSYSTRKYGIQLDADHNADEAEVTETSQVISSLDATGLYHDEVYAIYNALGKQTIKASNLEIKVAKAYLNSLNPNNLEESILKEIKKVLNKENLSNLDLQDFVNNNPKNPIAIQVLNYIRDKFDGIYDIIGRTIINNLKSNNLGLTSTIIGIIKDLFNLSDSHIYDKFKIPFSDPNIYSTILSTVSSVLNKKSIKRKYPGTGQIMVPSYGVYQTYEITLPDVTTLYLTGEDLLNRAIRWNAGLKLLPNSPILALETGTDIEKFNNEVIKYYLDNNILNELLPYSEDSLDWISNLNPTDNVIVHYLAGDQEHVFELTLDSLLKYYLFTENPLEYLKKETIIATQIKSIEKNNRKPKDLAPMKINITYVNELGLSRNINLFNTWIYRELYKASINKDSKRVLELQQRLPRFVQKIDEGLYEQENGLDLQITKVNKKAAQVIQSYNYRTLFGIKEGDTLADIKEKGIDYFKQQYIEYNPLDSRKYDYDFELKNLNNKNNTYISIDGSNSSNIFTSRIIKWKPSQKRIKNVNEGNIINRVYIMSEDNRELYEIGRDIDVSSQYLYDEKLREILNLDGKVVDDKNIFYSRGKILKRIEFLTLYKVFPTNGKAFTKYNIDRNNLNLVLLPEEKSENAVRNIIQDIFESNNFLFIKPADIIRTSKYDLIKNIISKLSMRYSGTQLGNYYSNLKRNVFSRSKQSLGNSDLIYLNSGWIPSSEELIQFGLEIPESIPDIFSFLRRNRKNFTPEQQQLLTNLYARYINSLLSTHTQEFIDQYSLERYSSFLKSLYVTSSRIPAQSLQSFMLMKTVAFTGVGSNVAAVSHFLMFLLGSDLDIDKSYMMGLVMDDNGRYLGWSDLFDLSSLETIEASETLPLPQNREYKQDSNSSIIIDETEFNNSTTKAEELVAIGKILKQLNLLNNTNINASEKLIALLNKHESTKIPVKNEENILKNYISSNILQLIQKSGNILSAYTPIDLNALNDAKPKSSINLNLFNPATVFLMQYLNMTGKQVTGIAANGLKAQFMWRFAVTDNLRKGNDLYVDFDVTINRVSREIQPDETTTYVSKRIQTLPNINAEQVANKYKLIAKIAPDIITSLYISAATDNAKELILAVINSGNKMAKCHLYLATLGFDVSDIVNFMTSPAVLFISDLSNSNIFLGHDVKVDDVISLIEKYHNILLNSKTEDEKIDKISKLYLKGASKYLNKITIQRLNTLYNQGFYEKGLKNSFYEDTIDFKNILAGANEFSNLGRLLGINQGVATTKEGLSKFKNFLIQIMTTAENSKGLFEDNTRKLSSNQTVLSEIDKLKYDEIITNGFDANKWLSDLNYRTLVSDYYNKLKHSINVFYIADNIPHFKSMFEVANSVNIIDSNLSLKSILFNKFLKELHEKYKFIPKKYEDNLLRAIDEVIIEDFISRLNYKLPLLEGWKTITEKFELENVNSPKKLNVARNPSAFKYVFENYIIPMLKNVEDIKHNNFILNLVLTYDLTLDIPLYKANIDLLRKDSSPELYLKYLDLIKGLKELSKYNYAEHSLTDWFVLYNLIVNKNKYGSERLTTLFEDLLKNDKNSLIFLLLKTLGDLDYYKYNLSDLLKDVTLTDLLIKIAPTVSIETGRLEPFIISYSPIEGYIIKEKQGFGYKDFVNLVTPIEGETFSLQEDRVIRQQQYGFGLIFSRYVKNMMNEIDTNVEVLSTLILDRIFNYLINCE